MSKYRAILRQAGIEVARVHGDDPETVDREIAHYAMVYVQDGAVEITRNRALASWAADKLKNEIGAQ